MNNYPLSSQPITDGLMRHESEIRYQRRRMRTIWENAAISEGERLRIEQEAAEALKRAITGRNVYLMSLDWLAKLIDSLPDLDLLSWAPTEP